MTTMNRQRSFYVRNWPGSCLKCSPRASSVVETCATLCTDTQVIISSSNFCQGGSSYNGCFSFVLQLTLPCHLCCTLLPYSILCVPTHFVSAPCPGLSDISLFCMFISNLAKESCCYVHVCASLCDHLKQNLKGQNIVSDHQRIVRF